MVVAENTGRSPFRVRPNIIYKINLKFGIILADSQMSLGHVGGGGKFGGTIRVYIHLNPYNHINKER